MKLPRHIAIIMDGNGRWAEKRKRSRTFGHIKGALRAKEVIKECSKMGVEFLTLYAFSIENWNRPKSEVLFLMKLLIRHLEREREKIHRQNIRFLCIGRMEQLPERVQQELQKSIDLTKNNTGMTLTFALSYGARQEVTQAIRKMCNDVQNQSLSIENIDEETIQAYLSTYPTPDPDLIIRTSGETRVSNFLLWQMAYSELYFTETSWPDFNDQCLHEALIDFSQRNRRFGTVLNAEELTTHPHH